MVDEIDDINLSSWVDSRLEKLDVVCAPNTERALQQLRERKRSATLRPGIRVWMPVSIAAAVCLIVALLPWKTFRGAFYPARSTATSAAGGAAPQTTKPQVIYRVEPQYTPEARQAGIRGTVVLRCVVHADGTLAVTKLVRGLGYGLDESAADALVQWRFDPGTKDGTPTDVSLNIEVNFHPKEDEKGK